MRKVYLLRLIIFLYWAICLCKASVAQYTAEYNTVNDPLPSWNNGNIKQAIISYIHRITDSTSTHFIPVIDRIATFDNDGTLWAEQPIVQELFAFYRVKKMVEKKPALKTQQPFKAVPENDKAYFKNGGEKALIQLVAATHAGMTED